MLVNLRTIQPNPMRDFSIDPIDDEVVESLRQSIEEDGFWGGVVCRELPDGTIQTGAGHHRIRAAIAAGLTHADLYVVPHFDDSDMVRVYTRENATQRGNSGTALAGSVAAALRLIAKAAFTGNLSRIYDKFTQRSEDSAIGRITKAEGVGEPLLTRFFHEHHIPNMGESTVRQQLANLKASGAYARIMTEVQEDIESEREAARQQAERERQELEEKKQATREAEARRQAAAENERRKQQEAKRAAAEKRAAREERERADAEARQRRAEEEEAQEALKRKEEEALRESLDRERQELEAKHRATEAERQKSEAAAIKAREAAEKAEEQAKRTFDFEGVSRHLKNAHQISTFREQITRGLAAQYYRVEDHEPLAARIVEKARQSKIHHERITADFIKACIEKEVWAARQAAAAVSREEERQRLEESYVADANRWQEEIARHFRAIRAASHKLQTLHEEWPDGLSFPFLEGFTQALRQAKEDIDRLVERVDG